MVFYNIYFVCRHYQRCFGCHQPTQGHGVAANEIGWPRRDSQSLNSEPTWASRGPDMFSRTHSLGCKKHRSFPWCDDWATSAQQTAHVVVILFILL
jgi:hypothetical protein